jgi:thioredoxin reductase
MELPLHGKVKFREIQKEPLLELFTTVVKQNELDIRNGEKVTAIEQHAKHYKVTTSKAEYEARKVLLAIGRRGTPRKIGCPGEKCEKVAYRLLEPEKYYNKRILVVGGGDSAVEAAVALSGQPGNKVYLSYRGDKIFRIKEGNRERLEKSSEEGKVKLLLNSNVTEITSDLVKLDQAGTEVTLQNDQIFVMIGGELPTEFLKSVGIAFERKYGEA